MPSRRSTPRLIAPSSRITGLVAVASRSSGIATRLAMASGLVSASRLGISSPKITELAVISATAVPMPSGRAYWCASGQAPRNQSAICRPIASPPNTPVQIPIRVIPTCTVDSRWSGCSAIASALRAPRLGRSGSSASCLRRSLREVITAISDIAKNPFSAIRANTTSNSATGAPVPRGPQAGAEGRRRWLGGLVHGVRRGAPR